jgi:hypothetical protein
MLDTDLWNRTVSEELEDFVEVSCAVDISKDEQPIVHMGTSGL